MTKLLEQALEAARALPPEAQDDIARVVFQLSAAERAVIDRSRAAAARGEFATEDQVRDLWQKHGL
jgi:hypothetical protein